MTTNRLTARKQVLPRPAICASKQKIYPEAGDTWIIPRTVRMHLVYGGGSGTPPEWFRDFTLLAQRRDNRLDWHCMLVAENVNYVVRLLFDPVLGRWTYIHSEFHANGQVIEFTQFGISEEVIPYRHGSFTHDFQVSTGQYLQVLMTY
jgi:hypothetical protein